MKLGAKKLELLRLWITLALAGRGGGWGIRRSGTLKRAHDCGRLRVRPTDRLEVALGLRPARPLR
ncbi:MAG TPA: hypothetical protein VHT23_02210 [Gemmatimonadaceae bacterium]|nr:hypothetical protein [Gemmatimonadaceae bacterium]